MDGAVRIRSNLPDLFEAMIAMRYRALCALLLTVLLISVSCATASRGGERRSGSQSRLSDQELADTAELTLYDAIQRLRPFWLRARGNSVTRGPPPVIVYLDNIRVGDASYLRGLRVDMVEEVSYVNATDATTRWGIGVSGGVIMVKSKT